MRRNNAHLKVANTSEYWMCMRSYRLRFMYDCHRSCAQQPATQPARRPSRRTALSRVLQVEESHRWCKCRVIQVPTHDVNVCRRLCYVHQSQNVVPPSTSSCLIRLCCTINNTCVTSLQSACVASHLTILRPRQCQAVLL